MGAIAKMKNGKWRCQIRKLGVSECQTFYTEREAKDWSRLREAEIIKAHKAGISLSNPKKELKDTTLADLVTRYLDTEVPKKKGAVSERSILNRVLRHPMSKKLLSGVTAKDWCDYRDSRMAEVSPVTVKRNLCVCSDMYSIAAEEWDMPLENPIKRIIRKMKVKEVARERRLEPGEWERIKDEGSRLLNPVMWPLFHWQFVIGMRLGESLAMKWEHIDFKKQELVIPMSKNGRSRKLGITNQMREILESLESDYKGYVFPVKAANAKMTWMALRERAGCPGLRLHDGRHESISRMFEAGLDIPNVAARSGHQSWAQLKRYTQVRPNDPGVLAKLNGAAVL